MPPQPALNEEAAMNSKKQQRHTNGKLKHISSSDDNWMVHFSFVDFRKWPAWIE